MGRRESTRDEAKFVRGETGVDGLATEEQQDEAEVERDKARESLLRGRAYLGREFLTWLLWRSESGDAITQFENLEVTVLKVGRIVLKGVVGEVTELIAKGTMAPYSDEVKHALDRGLLVHAARLQLTHEERIYEVTLDAEFLDIRAAKLPELMTEEEDDRIAERLYLTEKLTGLVDALMGSFLEARGSMLWNSSVVPAMKAWMQGDTSGSARNDDGILGRAARAMA